MSAALKRASALLLAAALLAVPASAAGSAGDPLVSRSYAESWGEALAGEAAEAAAQVSARRRGGPRNDRREASR